MTDKPVSPFLRQEMLRQHDAGMSIDQIGAKFRRPYELIADVLAEDMKGRADRWAREEHIG